MSIYACTCNVKAFYFKKEGIFYLNDPIILFFIFTVPQGSPTFLLSRTCLGILLIKMKMKLRKEFSSYAAKKKKQKVCKAFIHHWLVLYYGPILKNTLTKRPTKGLANNKNIIQINEMRNVTDSVCHKNILIFLYNINFTK